jgi:DNA-binding response OmpR family regulator
MSEGRILIVDDSDNIRNVLQMNFEWLGYQVTCARDGEEALRLVATQPPELIILDVMMPRRNGYQVCRTLKMDAAHKDIPIIFLTAKDQKEDRFWGKDCGADEYLTKPFSAAKLERVIARLLRRPEGAPRETTDRTKALVKEGDGPILTSFQVDRKSLMIFRQKYGEIRYQEALESVSSTIDVVLRADMPEVVVERCGDGGFRAVLPCDRAHASEMARRVRLQSDLLLRSFYDRDDAERGYVVTRVNASGPDVHVPLMTIETSVAVEAPAA